MVRKPRERAIPKGPLMKKRCQDIAMERSWIDLRERHKKGGMLPRESAVRAYVELGIEEKWLDWRKRQTQAQIMAKMLPLSPAEIKEVLPGYHAPSVTKGAKHGDQTMSLVEELYWARDKYTLVKNGGDQPEYFPNIGCMFWYQVAVTSPDKFQDRILKVSAKPDGDDEWAKSSEVQLSECEKQIEEALHETGSQLREYEQEFSETLDEVLRNGSEGTGVEPTLSA